MLTYYILYFQIDYQFYTGEGFNQDGLIALLNYREDGITPYFTLFKDGLKEEKVVCTKKE
jgi:hypothetical protein